MYACIVDQVEQGIEKEIEKDKKRGKEMGKTVSAQSSPAALHHHPATKPGLPSSSRTQPNTADQPAQHYRPSNPLCAAFTFTHCTVGPATMVQPQGGDRPGVDSRRRYVCTASMDSFHVPSPSVYVNMN